MLPVVIGIVLHKRFGKYAHHHQKALKTFDQSVILVIIYCSFCKSFSSGVFSTLSWTQLGILTVGMIALFLVVVFLTGTLSRALGFRPADRITAIFCGSKKSLVQGTVMSKVLFPGSATIGIILLPLMLYHALQLIAASILAQRIAIKEENEITG
jgi:sodium/bile acid cotransporter 7